MSKGLCSLNVSIVGLNLEIDASFIIDEREKKVKGNMISNLKINIENFNLEYYFD